MYASAPNNVARADDLDPFKVDGDSWKSFQRYKEDETTRVYSAMTGNLEKDAGAVSEARAKANQAPEPIDPSEDQKTTAAQNKKDIAPPSLKPVQVAEPERPIAPPVMPALNKDFDIRVSSTVDDVPPQAHIAHIDSTPDLQLPKQDWMDAQAVALRSASGQELKEVPINVRLSPLPGNDPMHAKNIVKALAQLKPPPPQDPVIDNAACAAIDAYKKRQLEAIQSDRRTLAALQAAIAQLGLKKELSFMDGAEGQMNTPKDTAAPSLSDLEASTAPTASAKP